MGKLKVDLLGTSFTIQANEETEYLEKLPFFERIANPTATLKEENTEITVSEETIFLCRI